MRRSQISESHQSDPEPSPDHMYSSSRAEMQNVELTMKRDNRKNVVGNAKTP